MFLNLFLVDGTLKISGIIYGTLIYIKYKSCTIYTYILTQNLFSENVQHVILNKLNQNKVLKSPDKFAFYCQFLKVFFCFLDLMVNDQCCKSKFTEPWRCKGQNNKLSSWMPDTDFLLKPKIIQIFLKDCSTVKLFLKSTNCSFYVVKFGVLWITNRFIHHPYSSTESEGK